MTRCERCDRPVTPWQEERDPAPGECWGPGACDFDPVDWRARALAAEAALADAAAVEREACAGLADRTEARWREQERTSDDDFTRTRCFARADVAATLARAIRARGAK